MRALLRNAEVCVRGVFSRNDIVCEGGLIKQIAPRISGKDFDRIFDLTGCFILPGLADVHVHLREPGFSYKETLRSGTLAAARGGFTCVCTMPNVSPAPDSPENLRRQLELIKKDACVDVRPYACITKGGTGRGELVDFKALAAEGCAAFSDDGRGVQSGGLMQAAMRAARDAGKIIAAHCEDESLLTGGCIHDGAYAAAHGYRGISSGSEWKQVGRDIGLVRETGCGYHVCHVSTKESVEIIRRAKDEGLPVTCETAPHYLLLCDEDLRGDGRFKMNPPLREAPDRAALIEGLLDGTVDIIATDHAPHSAAEKSLGLEGSAFGVVGLETSLPLMYTGFVETGLMSMERLVELMCLNPRRRFSLGGGVIEIGKYADITVFDPDVEYIIEPEKFLSAGRATPFAGQKVRGEAVLTLYKGEIVWQSPDVAACAGSKFAREGGA